MSVISGAAYDDWKEGLIGPEAALRTLCVELGETESDLDPLQKEREQLRAHISEIVDRLGGKADVQGFGKLEITSPVKTGRYDTKQLDALVRTLLDEYPHIARSITACRAESARAGSLRITREKV